MAALCSPKGSETLFRVLVMASFVFALSANAQQPTPQEVQDAKDKVVAEDSQAAKERLADIKGLSECSLARTNGNCKLTINRQNPITPPTIQMYSNQTLTVIVQNPYSFERYFLDYQSGQATLTPDVASSIVQGLLPSLQKVGMFHGFDFVTSAKAAGDHCDVPEITDTNIPDAGDVFLVIEPVGKCVAQLALQAIGIYQELEPYVAPDARVPSGEATAPKTLDQISTQVSVNAATTGEPGKPAPQTPGSVNGTKNIRWGCQRP